MFFIFIIIVSLLVAIWLFIIVLVTNLIKEYAELLNESFIAVLHFSLSLSTIFLVILSIKSPILEILSTNFELIFAWLDSFLLSIILTITKYIAIIIAGVIPCVRASYKISIICINKKLLISILKSILTA